MANRYYSTKTVLDWLISHYVMGRKHYTYAAIEFFPYRRPNPESSNPLHLYRNYYTAWKDKDGYSQMILQKKAALRAALDKTVIHDILDRQTADRITDAIDNADSSLFYPIVYVVDIDNIASHRLEKAGSAIAAASHEVLIRDLNEDEFEILFDDFREDQELANMLKADRYLDTFALAEFIAHRQVTYE